ESWTIQIRFTNGGLGSVRYMCGSNTGYEREVIDIVGSGRSARISGFRTLTLYTGSRRQRVHHWQPDMGQRAMLEAAMTQFGGKPGARDDTASFILSTQALLAAQRSIIERRVVTLEPHFPFSPVASSALSQLNCRVNRF